MIVLRIVKIIGVFKKNWLKGEKNENGVGNNGLKKFSYNRFGIEIIRDLVCYGDLYYC